MELLTLFVVLTLVKVGDSPNGHMVVHSMALRVRLR